MAKTLYLLLCTEDEDQQLTEHGLDYLLDPDSDIRPFFMKVRVGNESEIVQAFFHISRYGFYRLLTEQEYNEYIKEFE